MLTEVVVGIISLLIATLDTAIALWECIRNNRHATIQESRADRSSDTDDVRLSGQGVLPAVTNTVGAESMPLHTANPDHRKSDASTSSRGAEYAPAVQHNGNSATRETLDGYSNAV